MPTLSLRGGLGNQMFQYAKARADAGDKTIVINTHNLSHTAKGDVTRKFGLDHFAIGPVTVIDAHESDLKGLYAKILNKIIPGRPFFQSEKYFKHAEARIRKEFTLKEPLSTKALELKATIEKAPVSILLHVRRGDYVTDARTTAYHGVCGIGYYQKAIETLAEKLGPIPFEIFVFSDDIAWTKEHLKFPYPIHFASNPTIPDFEEIILMSFCSHAIIANSSYSWWSAWLNQNPNKIVIAPKKWFAHSDKKTDIIPASWIQL